MSIIPGLLQTEDYARALMMTGATLERPDLKLDNVVTTRIARQQRLFESDPMALHVLLDEAAILRVVGGPDVMQEQLARLLAAVGRKHITVQIIPIGVGSYGSMSGSCVIIDYPQDDETPAVFLEYPGGGAWVDNAEDVERFTTMFDEVARLALSPARSTDLIHERIKALENP
jgi:hypothetical protein